MIDRDRIEASMADGVLKVVMLKVEELKPHRIPIHVSE
jgi:HSP20 family molecular chaperone IbpA